VQLPPPLWPVRPPVSLCVQLSPLVTPARWQPRSHLSRLWSGQWHLAPVGPWPCPPAPVTTVSTAPTAAPSIGGGHHPALRLLPVGLCARGFLALARATTFSPCIAFAPELFRLLVRASATALRSCVVVTNPTLCTAAGRASVALMSSHASTGGTPTGCPAAFFSVSFALPCQQVPTCQSPPLLPRLSYAQCFLASHFVPVLSSVLRAS
jgi:hypothetical protein